MKTVAMMKQAIKESKLNGYKWTADKNGLHWSYGVDFKLHISKEVNNEYVMFEDEEAGVKCAVCIDERFADGSLFVATYDEAIYKAALGIIAKANYLY